MTPLLRQFIDVDRFNNVFESVMRIVPEEAQRVPKHGAWPLHRRGPPLAFQTVSGRCGVCASRARNSASGRGLLNR